MPILPWFRQLLERMLAIAGCTWLAVFIVRTFFVSVYKIPSESMLPNIWPGDWIVVDKAGYGSVLHFFGEEWQTPKLRKIKRGDVVVFHFPEGDTVYRDFPIRNYYDERRWCKAGKKETSMLSEKVEIPIHYRILYVKRCLGMPGDTFEIKQGKIIINGMEVEEWYPVKRWYHIYSKSIEKVRESMAGMPYSGLKPWKGHYVALLTLQEFGQCKTMVENRIVDSIRNYYETWINPGTYPFLSDKPISWTWDNYGPVYIPRKGDTLSLAGEQYYRYQRLIETYESNDLRKEVDTVWVNGRKACFYVCKQDYYFMIGDNRHNSLDSRNWGLVPEDHLIGKAHFIGWSHDVEVAWWQKIRWNRVLKGLK